MGPSLMCWFGLGSGGLLVSAQTQARFNLSAYLCREKCRSLNKKSLSACLGAYITCTQAHYSHCVFSRACSEDQPASWWRVFFETLFCSWQYSSTLIKYNTIMMESLCVWGNNSGYDISERFRWTDAWMKLAQVKKNIGKHLFRACSIHQHSYNSLAH